MKTYFARRIAIAIAIVLLVALPALVATPGQAQPVPTLAPMIEKVSPAVVNISVSGRVDVSNPLASDPFFRRFFEDEPSQREFQSAGSGVIVDAQRGLLLTNHHVIENATNITVTLLDNRSMMARVIGSDPASDLAVLEIDAPNLTQLSFGDSENLHVGDYVVAIGNPFGFSHTVTSGIVSGLGRSGVNPDRNAYEDFIQTDASINPGNSGGALVDLRGLLVGINSAIISRGGGNIGIGFAIPVSMVRNVMDQLVEFGEVRRGLLGVTINSITPEVAELYELENTAGAIVVEVAPGSAADAAGIEVEDIIVSIDGMRVGDSGALRNAIGLLRPGAEIAVGLIRDGRNLTLTAVLGELSPPSDTAAVEPEASDGDDPVLEGVELAPYEADDGAEGLLVVGLAEGSPALLNGLQENDLILRINRRRVTTLAEARGIVSSSNAIVLQVRRGNRDTIVFIP